MTKQIFKAVCLAAIAVFGASLVIIMGALYGYFSEMQMKQIRIQSELAARGVENNGLAYLDSLKDEEYRVTWIAADGTVKYDSRTDGRTMENHLEREEIREALSGGIGESARYSSTLMEQQLYCARKLADGTVLRLSGTQYTWWTLALGMQQPILLIASFAIGFSLFLAFRFSRKIVEPLNRLDLDSPRPEDIYEELSPLVSRIGSQKRQLKTQAEEKAKAEQMRREFTANVSHELKTPLQSISGCAELLLGGMVKPEDVPRFSRQIFSESQRMIVLIEDIIKLSHLDEVASDMQWENADLYELAERTAATLMPAAEKAGVLLLLTGKKSVLYGIPQLLSGIIFNLCDNAIKYNHPGGNAVIHISDDEDTVYLSVSDNGIGIPHEQQSRIFERFYRVDKSHSKEVGGTGLGLSIVKHSAKLHHAEIRLQSTLGKGTKITISFPKRHIVQLLADK